MNKTYLTGNVVRDAEAKIVLGNKTVINFDLATDESYTDKSGERIKRVQYTKCVLWRDNDNLVKFLRKGTKVLLEGKTSADAYVNKEGKAVGVIKLTVNHVELLSPRKEDLRQPTSGEPVAVPGDDDLPF